MRRWPPLSEYQVSVLRDVSQGAVSSRNSELARTVYALRERGLVKTRKGEHRWVAQITEAGSFYIAHGSYRDDVAPTPERVKERALPIDVAVEELLRELDTHDGIFRIEDPGPEIRAQWRRALNRAKRSGQVPEGYHLRHHGRDSGDLVIELVAGAHPDAERLRDPKQRVAVAVDEGPVNPLIAKIDGQSELGPRLRRKPAQGAPPALVTGDRMGTPSASGCPQSQGRCRRLVRDAR